MHIKMPRVWQIDDMRKAYQAVISSKMKLVNAAKYYHIPRQTLADRVHGRIAVDANWGGATALNEDEEEALVKYITYMSGRGFPLTVAQVCCLAGAIVKEKGRDPFKGDLPTEKWWRGFKKRHPSLSLRSCGSLDKGRATMTNEYVLRDYFQLLKTVLEENSLMDKPQQIYNCDETAVFLNKMSQKVIAPVRSKRVYSLSCGTSEHISAHCCVAADGTALPPMIIFSGGFPGGAYQRNGPINALYGHSHSGFMDSELYFQWFLKCFLVHARKERPLLLVQDGHSSHLSLRLIETAIKNNIILLCLPPHTTHVLQPLDVAVYRSLKASFSRLVNSAKLLNSNLWISKGKFTGVFKLAFEESFSMKSITEGFRKCGIFPFNPDAIDKSFIAPSQQVPKQVTLAPVTTPVQQQCDISVSPQAEVVEEPLVVTESDPAEGDGVAYSCPAKLALRAVEGTLKPEQIKLYEKRYNEGYDAPDPLYYTWKKLKDQVVQELTSPTEKASVPLVPPVTENILVKHGIIPEDLALVLTPPTEKTSNRASKKMNAAKVLTSNEVANELREQARKKKELEDAKEKRKAEREQKREKQRCVNDTENCPPIKKARIDEQSKMCGVCKDDDEGVWISCSVCTVNYHVECVGVCALNEMQVKRLGFWKCYECESG